jgi:hypothetical protein
MRHFVQCLRLGRVMTGLGCDFLRFLAASLRPRTALVAENLFLRKQLALYRERQVKPHRASDTTRLGLVLLARWFAWREALTIVQPARSSGGTGKPSCSSGAGGLDPDGPGSRRSCSG